MQKLRKILLTSLMLFTFPLSSCGETPLIDPKDCTKHVDSNKDGKCDLCGTTMEQEVCLNHYDADGDKKCDYCGVKMPSGKQTFKGLSLKNKVYDYDGKTHSLFVEGLPEFATVTYLNNDQTNAGKYKVTAIVKANNYNTKSLEANLTIRGMQFEGITFEDLEIDYDGQEHSIAVKGLPDFALVEYTENGQKDPGRHKVVARVYADNYEELYLNAYIIIHGKQFTGIKFEDGEFAYDGKLHYIYVSGDIPEDTKVVYEGNGKSSKGTYQVTATLTKEGYETLVLTANLKISMILPKATLVNRTLIYTGLNQYITFKLPENLPRGTEAVFKVDGKTVTEDDFKVKTVGEHTASITLRNTGSDYSSSTVSAKINVIRDFGGVDETKTAFTIDSSLKYQTLRQKIFEGNFTLKYEYIDDFYYPDKTEKHTLSSTKYYYMCGDELFEFSYSNEEFSVKPEYALTTYKHTKFYGDQIKSVYFADGILNGDVWDNSYTMDGSLFQENVVGRTGLKVLAWLNEAADGGFENGEEGGYHINHGSFKIDSANNCFVEDVLDHYYHTEWNHDEHMRYTIYNIGNTKVDVPDVFNALKVDANFGEPEVVYKNGFHLYNKGDSYEINPILNAVSKAYLSPGIYEFPAEVCGKPVTSMDYGYYDPDIDMDLSGYTFKTYFDEDGYYKGEYASLGQLSGYSKIDQLESDGATVLYYDDWH